MKRALTGLSLYLILTVQATADAQAGTSDFEQYSEPMGTNAVPISPQETKHFIIDSDWETAKSSDQTVISTANVKNSDFKAFRAETTIPAPLDQVFAVIADPGSCPLWVDGCIQSNNISVTSFNDRFSYALSGLPWPFKDRELIVHIKTGNTSRNHIIIQMNTVMNPNQIKEFKANPDYVQVNHSIARYELSRQENDLTKVVWEQHTEPSGDLPAWLVNVMLTDLPYKSLKGLSTTANSKRYQNAQIFYDKNENLVGLTLNNGERINNDTIIEKSEPTLLENMENRASL